MNATVPTFYRIFQSTSGEFLGIYGGADPDTAIAAMLADAQCDEEPDAGLVAEPVRYSVIVVDPNTRRRDGSPIVERSCGHEHRSLEAADRCLGGLRKPYRDGSFPARWFRAEVRHADGTALSGEETDILADLRAHT